MRSGDCEAPRISLPLLRDGMNSNPRAPLFYIDKLQRLTLTVDLFAKKLASTNPIGSLIGGTISSLILSEIAFFVDINPS